MNTDKTKIMVFRKGGKLRKDEKWSSGGKSIEVVKKFKYLGYWFTTGNCERVQREEIASKARVATNAA